MDLAAIAPGMDIQRFPDFISMVDTCTTAQPYLYVEDCDGCQIGWPDSPMPRQFLRGYAAILNGKPDLADWRLHPGFEQIDAAREALTLIARHMS
jgi:hypothetical protein